MKLKIQCISAFEEHILKPALQFIGLDCEWNTNRPVSVFLENREKFVST